MINCQKGILAQETRLARYMFFSLSDINSIKPCLEDLSQVVDGELTVVGLGPSLIAALNGTIPGLQNLSFQSSMGIDVPSTPCALWLWLRGTDRGELYHRSRMLEDILATSFELDDVVDSFMFEDNRDLSGYVDGTENPQDEDALAAAIVQAQAAGMDGSSFVAIQQWLHDLDSFSALPENEQDDVFGRHVSNNEEFTDAPESAHVKRAAQESYEPEAFILRRSMPWADGMNAGLMFVAFGKSFASFEAILNRMLGHDDGIMDGLFSFTRPISSAYFWCPPIKSGQLDLTQLGFD